MVATLNKTSFSISISMQNFSSPVNMQFDQVTSPDRSAWQELIDFTVTGRQPYRWNRDEIYT